MHSHALTGDDLEINRIVYTSLMDKGIWAAIFALGALVAADQYFNRGYYSDAALTVLRQIRHSFGW